MIIGILKEQNPETRVSLLPEHIAPLLKWKVSVLIESGAGVNAFATDEKYAAAGATVTDRATILQLAEVLLSIQLLSDADIASATAQGRQPVLLGIFQPLYQPNKMQEWANRQCTILSIDMIPRTTRAQSMDVLSSQANIAGYKAVLLAAATYPRYFPMFMTAAGSIPPAKLLVLGAGVAGLQAIATARRLGAVVEVFDTRPAVKEEVMSLGAKFVEVAGAADASQAGGYAVEQSAEFMDRQKARIAESVAKADIVIATAQIQGKKAPILVTEEMVALMKDGSVIIDLAAATGGNTAVTQNNQSVQHKGVTIIGQSNLPATMPFDASKLYGKNILNFLQLIIDASGELHLNWDDDIVKGSCMAHGGALTNDRLRAALDQSK